MGFRSLGALVLLGVVLTSCGGGSGGSSDSEPVAAALPVKTACSTELKAIFQNLIDETNQVRHAHGVGLLKFSYKLGQAAQGHTEDMAARDYFAHHSPDGLSTIASRINATGYKFSLAAENLAAGYYSATDVVTDWLNSPGHRENLLNPEFTDVGFGLFFDTVPGVAPQVTFENYWAQEFGRPADGNSDKEVAYIPERCSIGAITSSDSDVLSGVVMSQTSGHEIEQMSAAPMKTPEPAIALGLLPALLGLIFLRQE
ncbi:MAG: CAP domain-containing protein [Leptolyngbyaceae cyanobacterium]